MSSRTPLDTRNSAPKPAHHGTAAKRARVLRDGWTGVDLWVALLAITLGTLGITGCGAGSGGVAPALAITVAISGQTVDAGQTEVLRATATGAGPLTYQWYKGQGPIPGAVASTYTIITTGADNGTSYTVAVANATGSVMSAPFVLTVESGPSITSQPATQAVAPGQTATFSVSATGTAPLAFQWYLNGVSITGATSSTYTTPATSLSNSGAEF